MLKTRPSKMHIQYCEFHRVFQCISKQEAGADGSLFHGYIYVIHLPVMEVFGLFVI